MYSEKEKPRSSCSSNANGHEIQSEGGNRSEGMGSGSVHPAYPRKTISGLQMQILVGLGLQVFLLFS